MPTMNPPAVGPKAGATEMTTVIMPMTVPRRCGGTSVMATVIRVGIISAVPTACSTRPASNSSQNGARAASTVPVRKTPVEVPKICRVVNLSSRKPVVGITTPMVSKKPVSSHCAEVAGMEKSAMMVGSATESAVSFKIITIAVSTKMVRLATVSAEILEAGF